MDKSKKAHEDWVRELKELCSKPGSEIEYVGPWTGTQQELDAAKRALTRRRQPRGFRAAPPSAN